MEKWYLIGKCFLEHNDLCKKVQSGFGEGWQVPSRGPPRCDVSSNAFQTCRCENNQCYIYWMCWPRKWRIYAQVK